MHRAAAIKRFCHETRISPPLVFLTLLPLLFLCSCKDDNPTQSPPSVKITSGPSDLTSLTFTIEPQHAQRCAYLVVPTVDAVAVDADAVLERGKAADANATATYTVDGLDPGTAYEIYAAVGSADGVAVDRISMSTVVGPADGPSVSITPDEVSATHIAFTLTPSHADRCGYLVVAADGSLPDAAAVLRDGFPADASAPSGHTVGELMPGTDYVVVAAVSQDGIYGPTTSHSFTTASGPQLPGLEADATDCVFTYVERSNYFGDLWGKNTGWFVYGLRDCTPDENGDYPTGTAELCFELHADLAASEGGVLPAGTYRVGDRIVPGACLPGRILEVNDDSYVADVTYYACDGQWGIVEGGTVTIEKAADGYRAAFDFTTVDGHRVTASYAGSLVADSSEPVDPDATSTLGDDYAIRFAQGEGTKVTAYYYGYDKDLLADLWSVYMEPQRKEMDAEGFMMDLLVDPAFGFEGGFPAGTADEPHEYGVSYYGEPGHYLPGEYDADRVMIHSWYLGGYVAGPDDAWLVTRYAAVKMGYIYVSRTDDTYTVTLEYSDENWHTVTGTWSGPVTAEDRSAAPASPVAARRTGHGYGMRR